MWFTSDNASGAAPEIMAAVMRANEGSARSYGADALMDWVRDQVREVFESSISFGRVALEELGIDPETASATAHDVRKRDTARLMGIFPERIFAFTFFLASAVGALGALFFAANVGVVRFDFGVQLGLIGFSAAVIGGLGSMSGAILGALAIAGIESLVQANIPDGASYRLVFVFLLVIVMLCLRPSGLLGKPVMEKV